MYINKNLISMNKSIFEQPFEIFSEEQMNFYKLYCFLSSKDISLTRAEIRMYLRKGLIEFKRDKKSSFYCFDKEDFDEGEDTSLYDTEDIYFKLVNGRKKEVLISEYYEEDKDTGLSILKPIIPTEEYLNLLDENSKIDIISKELSMLPWDGDEDFCGNGDFSNAVRNAYRKTFSYEELINLLKSFSDLWEYIKDDISELKDFKALKNYLLKENGAGDYKLTINNSDGSQLKLHEHFHIELYSKKKKLNSIYLENIKKAYKNNIISLALDNENIVGFKVKNLKNVITKEKINDVFSIDYFRFEASDEFFETDDISLVKEKFSEDEIAEMIYESLKVCFKDIYDSVLKKIM